MNIYKYYKVELIKNTNKQYKTCIQPKLLLKYNTYLVGLPKAISSS